MNVICERRQGKGDRDDGKGVVLGIDPAKGVLEGPAGLSTFHRNSLSHDIRLF